MLLQQSNVQQYTRIVSSGRDRPCLPTPTSFRMLRNCSCDRCNGRPRKVMAAISEKLLHGEEDEPSGRRDLNSTESANEEDAKKDA